MRQRADASQPRRTAAAVAAHCCWRCRLWCRRWRRAARAGAAPARPARRRAAQRQPCSTQMAADIAGGNPQAAAQLAMANKNFYNVTLKNFVAAVDQPRPHRCSCRSTTTPRPSSAWCATTSTSARCCRPTCCTWATRRARRRTRRPTTTITSISTTTTSTCRQRCARPRSPGCWALPVAATAGVMTTRAAAQAFFIAGTNRAMFRFTMMNYLCRDMEQLQDSSLPPDRIRQDVSRSPGGDSRVFLNNCIGCHNGMDPLAQAFAYYNFDATTGRLPVHRGRGAAEVPDQLRQLQARLRHHRRSLGQLLAPGRQPAARLGAALPGSGNGAKSHGPGARAQRRLRAVPGGEGVQGGVPARAGQCRRSRRRSATIKAAFRAGGYKMKQVFADAAVYCMGN